MVKKKRTKEQTTIYKPLHRKLKIEHHERTNLVSFATEWSIKLSTVVDIEKNQNRSDKNSETLQESSPNKISASRHFFLSLLMIFMRNTFCSNLILYFMYNIHVLNNNSVPI